MMTYTESDKDHFQQVLQDDIEILLEEFEELTGRQISIVTIMRVECDEKKYHKAFEYIVKVYKGNDENTL